jgi:protocatechuate 3,4-dioxygenase beta subunit
LLKLRPDRVRERRWSPPGRLLLLATAAVAVGALLAGPRSARALTTTAGVVASITASGATSQEASVNSQYGQPLQVQVLDANGQSVQDVTVTFSLGTGPTGAGAGFLGSGAQATVSTNAHGQATSPPFVANGSPGAFSASASTADISSVATFSLANHATRAAIEAIGDPAQTATVRTRYRRPLQARVLDANRQPVEGVTVTFTISKPTSGAGASFPDDTTQATATTDADGRASSPPVVATATAGRFTATAVATGTIARASYSLRNVAGRPATVSAGAASGEATPAGSRFPIPLAVTVGDADKNPVAGAVVIFTAPAHGPSGRFGPRHSGRAGRVVHVRTDFKGTAVAPLFTAGNRSGGYVLTATVAGTRLRTAFALVNRQTT